MGLVVVAHRALGGTPLAARVHEHHAVAIMEVLELVPEDLAREGEAWNEHEGGCILGTGVPHMDLDSRGNGDELGLGALG